MHFGEYELGLALNSGASQRALEEHANRCRDCRVALDRARESHRRIGAVLCLLDHPAQPVSFGAIEARALAPFATIDGVFPPERRPVPVLPFRDPVSFWNPRATDRRRIAWRRGIVGFLLAAGAAAAAVSTPPVRQFVAVLVHARAPQRPVRSPESPQTTASPSTFPSLARGVAITPHSGRAVIVWPAGPPGSVARVKVMEAGNAPGPRVSVLANGDGVAYRVSGDTIFVDNRVASAVSFEVDVPPPSELAAVTLVVAEHSVFSRHGMTLDTGTPRSSDGSYSIDLTTGRAP
jgi:hypothetical protein